MTKINSKGNDTHHRQNLCSKLANEAGVVGKVKFYHKDLTEAQWSRIKKVFEASKTTPVTTHKCRRKGRYLADKLIKPTKWLFALRISF